MGFTNQKIWRFPIPEWVKKIFIYKPNSGLSKRVKTPTVLQMEAVECGAASLAIILGYYGRIVPLPELRQACGVSRNGSNASNIIKAAKNYGLIGKGFKKSLEALPLIHCPYIIFWNFNHFLVVEGFSKEQVYINDPASGPRSVSLSEFDQCYTGIVLVFQLSPNFTKGGRNPSIIKALWIRLRGSLGAITYCIIAGFLLVIPGLALSAFTQIFIDNVLIQGRYEWLLPLLLGLFITAILRLLLAGLRFKYLRHLQLKLAITMSSQFLWHILRLPISFYAQRFAGEIAHRLSINNTISEVLSGRLATTIIDLVMLVFYALVMSQYDGLLTAIVMVCAIINLLALQSLSRSRIDANRRLAQESSKAVGVAIAGLQNIETLKASGLESDFFARWAGYYTKALNAQQSLAIPNQILGILPTFSATLTDLLLLILGGLRVMEGKLSIGMLIAFQSLIYSFLQPVNRLVSLGGTLQELAGDLERLEDVLDNQIDGEIGAEDDKNLAITYPRLQGYVEFRNITFGYSKIDPPLIENFSLIIQPGERIALVGASGSGKSTLAKLVSGLYKPWEGEIYFDQQNRQQIPHLVLTNSVAMVEQDILLFAGTIRDNLTLWDKSIPDSYLFKACQDAAIDDLIFSIAGGLDAEILEGGANFSGGQRQRLEIARALVNNPAILVMDEATSALDGDTEFIVTQNLKRRGCTCIIVAHRLSTIRDCDQIIVFESGKVMEQGTHTELWSLNGLYSQLIHSEDQNNSQLY